MQKMSQPFGPVAKFRNVMPIGRAIVMGTAMSVVLAGCGYFGTLTPKMESSLNRAETTAAAEKPENFQTLPPMGLNNKEYISAEVRNSLARLGELHQSLNTMQADMQQVAPSVDRLEAMKMEVRDLSQKFEQVLGVIDTSPAGQVNTMMPQDPVNPYAQGRPMQILRAGETLKPAAPAPAPQAAAQTATQAPAASQPAQYAPEVKDGMTGLIDVRFGEHASKTRIVLDVAKSMDIKFDLDAQENILVVELPGQVAGGLTPRAVNSALVKSYDIQKSGDNTLVIFSFKKPTKIIESMQLKGSGKAAHRIVFDMAK